MAGPEAGLDSAVKRLSGGDLADCVLQQTEVPTSTLSAQPRVALCPTGEVAPGKGIGGWPSTGPTVTPTPAPTAVPTPASSLTTTVPTATPVVGPKQKIIVVALDDTKGRIYRPRQIYTGPEITHYVPMEQRGGPSV